MTTNIEKRDCRMTIEHIKTRRRGKMFVRAICWTVGVGIYCAIKTAVGVEIDLHGTWSLWFGMMAAAVFVHFEPPEVIETDVYSWRKS